MSNLHVASSLRSTSSPSRAFQIHRTAVSLWYQVDMYNELRPASSDAEFLRSASAAMYGAMASEDPEAVWLMQGWLFFSDTQFWQPAAIEAYLRLVASYLFVRVYPQFVRKRWRFKNSLARESESFSVEKETKLTLMSLLARESWRLLHGARVTLGVPWLTSVPPWVSSQC